MRATPEREAPHVDAAWVLARSGNARQSTPPFAVVSGYANGNKLIGCPLCTER